MSDERPTDLLSALPRTRPHRRSEKREAPAAPRKASAAPRKSPATARKAPPAAKSKRLRQPSQPRGIPAARRAAKRKPAPTTGAELVGTAVQAVAELAEIGFALGARALRNAIARLPKP